ncbi:MAG: GGDEF domain-containing protein [Magnetospiraceae bacterium]
MRRIRKLSLSMTIIITFCGVLLFSTFTMVGIVVYLQSRTVSEISHNQALKRSRVVFQSLYAVMRKGWTRNDIADIINRLESSIGDTRIHLYRSPLVVSQFGDVPGRKTAVATDSLLNQALKTGEEQFVIAEDNIRFLYPILAQEECLDCHITSEVNALQGVLDVQFSTSTVQVPIQAVLEKFVLVFGLLFGLLFILVFIVLRNFVVRPVEQFHDTIEHMKTLSTIKELPARLSFRISELSDLGRSFNQLIAKIIEQNRALEELSIRDHLTNAFNRRYLAHVAEREIQRAQRYGRPFALLLIDLDHFKPINDQYGHEAGDAVLIRTAQTLNENIRAVDVAARIGGDEFVVLAPELTLPLGEQFGEKLRLAVESQSITVGNAVINAEMSLGVAVFGIDGETLEALTQAADVRMYKNKQRRKAQHESEDSK